MNYRQFLTSVAVLFTVALPVANISYAAPADDAPPAVVAEAESLKVALERMRAEYGALEEQLPTLSGEDSLITRREMSELLLTGIDEVYQLANLLAPPARRGPRHHRAGRVRHRPAGSRAGGAGDGDRTGRGQAHPGSGEGRDGRSGGSRHHRAGDGRPGCPSGRAVRARVAPRRGYRGPGPGRDPGPQGALRGPDPASPADGGGVLRLAMEERDRLQKQASQYPDDVAIRQEADAAQSAVDGAVASLDRTVRTMDQLKLDVTEYRTLIVEATGELSRGLSDAKVAMSLVQKWIAGAGDWLTTSGPNALMKILLFLAILLAFRLLSRLVRKALLRSIDSSQFQPSQLLRSMLGRLSTNLVMFFGLLIALSQIGVSLGPPPGRVGGCRFHHRVRLAGNTGQFRVRDDDPLLPALRRGRHGGGGWCHRHGPPHEPRLHDHSDHRQPDPYRAQWQDLGRCHS